jgi:trypsin
MQDNIGHFCGGSLIAKDMVLTAAHCQGGSYKVVIGRHNLNSKSGESISMRREIPYPQYNSKNTDGDWMIILLDSSTTQNVPLIKLNMDASKPSPQSEVTVMGWGDTTADDYTQELADELKSVTVNVISNSDCDASSGTINGWSDSYEGQITDNMMCARDNGEDSCQGDSGGPLVIEGKRGDGTDDIQVGVVSWGVGCASQHFPGVYARVSRVTDWIKQVVCTESSDPPTELCGGSGHTTTEAPNTTTEAPNSTTEVPNTSTEASTTTTEYSPTSTEYSPTSTEFSPTTTTVTPPTTTESNTYTSWPTWSPTSDIISDDITDEQAGSMLDVSNYGALGSVPDVSTSSSNNNWVTIIEDDFEEGFGFFNSGGPDAKWLTDKKERTGIIDLQERGDVISNSIDTSYSIYRVIFNAYLLSMEDDKSFCVDVSSDGGSEWTETQCWHGSDLSTKTWHDDLTVEFTPQSNPFDLKIRFRCQGTHNQDDVFIDKVAVQGVKNS